MGNDGPFTAGIVNRNGWSVTYKRAIEPDGTLLFPERLTQEFLTNVRKTLGVYLFANQYQNEVIPDEEKRFKKEWIRYSGELPEQVYRFAFIDPAIGQSKHHDYTGIVVVDVDVDRTWHIRLALRARLTPTQIVAKLFELQKQFKCQLIGIETVAYQESLLYFLDQEMKRSGQIIPIHGVKRQGIHKNTRILGLVPRFEWGQIYLARGLMDLEQEYATFPRGSHDDLLDALASLEELVYYPQRVKPDLLVAPPPQSPDYESWYIRNMHKKANQENQ